MHINWLKFPSIFKIKMVTFTLKGETILQWIKIMECFMIERSNYVGGGDGHFYSIEEKEL